MWSYQVKTIGHEYYGKPKLPKYREEGKGYILFIVEYSMLLCEKKNVEKDENLLCAKNMVEKENQRIMPIWCKGGPLNSSFILCSRTQIRRPIAIKAKKLVSQRSQVSGFKNIHVFLLWLSVGTIIAIPDSVYAKEKSTYSDLFAVIAMSPATASKF